MGEGDDEDGFEDEGVGGCVYGEEESEGFGEGGWVEDGEPGVVVFEPGGAEFVEDGGGEGGEGEGMYAHGQRVGVWGVA